MENMIVRPKPEIVFEMPVPFWHRIRRVARLVRWHRIHTSSFRQKKLDNAENSVPFAS